MRYGGRSRTTADGCGIYANTHPSRHACRGPRVCASARRGIMTTVAEPATVCAGTVDAARCAPCAWPSGWRPGSRSSGPARHRERGERCPIVRPGRPEYRCCSNASPRCSRARQPLGAGSLPKPPGSSRGRRCPTGGKLRIVTPNHALSPHRVDGDAPSGSLCSLTAAAVKLSSGCGSRATVQPGACSTPTAPGRS